MASLSGLRIHHCCELQCRLQLQLRSHIAVAVAMAVASSCSSDLIPSLGIPIYHSTALKSKKKKKNQKERERGSTLSRINLNIFGDMYPQARATKTKKWTSKQKAFG